MPRNDQVTRHWLLLQRLEGLRGATLQELAACLPEDSRHHSRTVRRDLEALEEHFPLIVERSGFRSFARNRFEKKSGKRLKKFFRICDTGCHTRMRSFGVRWLDTAFPSGNTELRNQQTASIFSTVKRIRLRSRRLV